MEKHRQKAFKSLMVLIGCSLSLGSLVGEDKKPPVEKTLATIDGTAISEAELNRAAAPEFDKLELQRLQFEAELLQHRHQVMEDTLNRLVEERILDSEAARQETSRQGLLSKEVDQKITDPTPEEMDLFYERNKERIGAPKEQVLAKIKQYLRQQSYNRVKTEYLDRLKKDRHITLMLDHLRMDVAVAGFPSRGKDQAPVTIVEFSDFQCPYCANFNSTLERVMKEFPTDVRLVFRQLPLKDIHSMAEKAAEASLCAQEQGKFWELHDLMFKDQASLKVEDLKGKAAGLGLDTSAFNACLDSDKQAQKIKDDIRDGARLGASGTPAVFINGRFFSGAHPYDEIASIIKEELQKHAGSSAAQ